MADCTPRRDREMSAADRLSANATPDQRSLMKTHQWHCRLSLVLALILLITVNGRANEPTPVYCTGKILEIDRCASAWLIRRFIEKDANFLFQDDEELLESTAIPFDTPTATLRRSHKQSTFEVIRDSYRISDPGVDRIAAIIHDIEINFWNNKTVEETRKFSEELNEIIHTAPDTVTALEGCFGYLDTFVNPKKQL